MKKWAYYNDNDPFVCEWARNLIRARLVPDGEIDCRSILSVEPSEIKGFAQAHFFCGILGWPYALELAGWGDRKVWSASCPCQPLSSAGQRKGHADERHLWPAFYRLVAECRPSTIFGEQVAGELGREWLTGVRADLEALGYAVGAADLCAAAVGSPQRRQRLYWVAHAEGRGQRNRREKIQGAVRGRSGAGFWVDAGRIQALDTRRIECGIKPLAPRIPKHMEQMRGYGNSIVPALAAEFISAYMETIVE